MYGMPGCWYEGEVLGVTNKQVEWERGEASRACCGVQINDVKLIFKLEKNIWVLCMGVNSSWEQKCHDSQQALLRPVGTRCFFFYYLMLLVNIRLHNPFIGNLTGDIHMCTCTAPLSPWICVWPFYCDAVNKKGDNWKKGGLTSFPLFLTLSFCSAGQQMKKPQTPINNLFASDIYSFIPNVFYRSPLRLVSLREGWEYWCRMRVKADKLSTFPKSNSSLLI